MSIKSYSTLDVKYDSTVPVISSDVMADRKPRPKGPVAHIDESERVKILARMKEKSISNAGLARACDVTPSAITLLLKTPIPKGQVRGCKFLAKLQAALDLAVTARRPAAVPSDKQRRVDLVLRALGDDLEALEHWLASGEVLANRQRKPL